MKLLQTFGNFSSFFLHLWWWWRRRAVVVVVVVVVLGTERIINKNRDH
jgi:hypothetical protein